MNEPSVLDFVKAKLKFWEKSDLRLPQPVERTRFEENGPEIAALAITEGSLEQPPAGGAVIYDQSAVRAPASVAARSPWLVLLPVVVALLAQIFLEPSDRNVTLAVGLYVITAILAFLAFWRGALVPADHPTAQPVEDDMDMHWTGTLVGLPLVVVAFVLFTNNRFTPLNVTLWVLGLVLCLFSFMQIGRPARMLNWAQERLQSLRQPGGAWNIRISGWTLLVIAVAALCLFFRFYRLDQIPIDMVSDHAEKLLDINDVVNGKWSIFFERNTGREPFQFYWTVLVMWIFNLPVSFFALKLGTVLTGIIVLYYTYRLGLLVANRWVALLALLFVGVAYWPNVISRISLRFPLYPLFVAPLLFYLIRGLRTGSRNDFIWGGLWLGIGLNGYTSSRIVPFLVVVAFGLYLLNRRSRGFRWQAWMGLMLIAFFALVICLPLIRYGMEHPENIFFRSMTRLGSLERPLEGSPLQIFISNFWAVLIMFFYDNGSIWVHSIPYRPAFDVVMAALFFVGVVLLLGRLIKNRDWEDALLLISVPILILPAALSLAFPGENPSLNRTSAAYVPALLIAAIALEAMLRGLARRLPPTAGRTAAAVLGIALVAWTVSNNYNLFFIQYDQGFRANAWNTREIGAVVKDFAGLEGNYDTYYVVGYPYWIDSRQVAIFAGYIDRDPGILPEQIPDTLNEPRMKMYILKPEDEKSIAELRQFYPNGRAELHRSTQPGKDFVTFLVPAQHDNLQ